jgi:hypothetical protein
MPIADEKEDEARLTSNDSLNRPQPVSVNQFISNITESENYTLEELEMEYDEEDEEYTYTSWIKRNIARGIIFIFCTIFLASSVLGFMFLFNLSSRRTNFFFKYCHSSTLGSISNGNCFDRTNPCEFDFTSDSPVFSDFQRTTVVHQLKKGKHKQVTLELVGTRFMVNYGFEDCLIKCQYNENTVNFQLLTDFQTFRNSTFIESVRICALNISKE